MRSHDDHSLDSLNWSRRCVRRAIRRPGSGALYVCSECGISHPATGAEVWVTTGGLVTVPPGRIRRSSSSQMHVTPCARRRSRSRRGPATPQSTGARGFGSPPRRPGAASTGGTPVPKCFRRTHSCKCVPFRHRGNSVCEPVPYLSDVDSASGHREVAAATLASRKTGSNCR